MAPRQLVQTLEWEPIDPSSVAPLKGIVPDMYNHMPTRFVPLEEAKARHWTYYYIGETCKYGHMAPRNVSNPRNCVDCHRVRSGRVPIGGKGQSATTGTLKKYEGPKQKAEPGAVARPIEPDSLEKRFLVEYVKHRDFAKAADACGRHESEFLGRLSYSSVFRDAVNRLEEDNGLARTPSMLEDFEWSDEKRLTLARIYSDTGDLARAMKAIGVGNYHYSMEIRENPEFSALMNHAADMADEYALLVATGRALDGDTRLLQMHVRAKHPEYRDSFNVDMRVVQLSEEQANAQLIQIIEQLGGRIPTPEPIIDAEHLLLTHEGEVEASGNAEVGVQAPPAQSNYDLV